MADPTPATLARLAADVLAGRVRVAVTKACPLSDATQAFTDYGAGAGKLAITVDR